MPALKKIIKLILIIVTFIIVFLILGFIYFFQISDSQYTSDPLDFDHSAYTPEYKESLADTIRRLRIDNLYWKNRLEMAEDESIDLLLDLVSRQIFIEIQGVNVYSSPVLYYTLNDSLQQFNSNDSVYKFLNHPLLLQSEQATIPKEPIQVREIRPRSDGENGLTHFRDPDSITYVNILLNFTGDLSITLNQVETAADPLNIPELPIRSSRFHIHVLLLRSSAETIYRAISIGHTSLALRLE